MLKFVGITENDEFHTGKISLSKSNRKKSWVNKQLNLLEWYMRSINKNNLFTHVKYHYQGQTERKWA